MRIPAWAWGIALAALVATLLWWRDGAAPSRVEPANAPGEAQRGAVADLPDLTDRADPSDSTDLSKTSLEEPMKMDSTPRPDHAAVLARLRPAIETQVGRHLEQVLEQVAGLADIDEEEKQRMADGFEEIARVEIARWMEHLSKPGTSPADLYAPGRDPVDESLVMAVLEDELTPDEFAAFERAHVERKAREVEVHANRHLRRLGRRLGLTETQKDQIFAILVAEGDPRLAAATPSGAAAGPGTTGTVEDEIRRVLTPEQRGVYDGDLAERAAAHAAWRQRWESLDE